ncbi:hypothetical protein ACFV0O_28810 [Kitasatospora sp. NPDC059577]|uniref:hypothetical protein n=1 Tax=Kitasatospora sp. NPDC059577 TaxID=3346873 RepID=UPI00369B1340
MEKALGLALGRRERVGAASPWLTGPAAVLFDAGLLVSLPALTAAVRATDEQALEAARTGTVAMFRTLPLLARLVSATAGDANLAGMKGFGQLDENPEFVQRTCRCWPGCSAYSEVTHSRRPSLVPAQVPSGSRRFAAN